MLVEGTSKNFKCEQNQNYLLISASKGIKIKISGKKTDNFCSLVEKVLYFHDLIAYLCLLMNDNCSDGKC